VTKRRVILLLIIIAAWGLRVWNLPHTPPGLWYDEAYYSMDAAWLLDGGPWRLFFAGNNGREPIFIYLQSLFIWMFGAKPLTSRLPAPLLGTLTVPLVYVLARRLGRGANWSSWLSYLATAGGKTLQNLCCWPA
jgi:4-amino-4-deoxy-L-arabinose transferase-like glycosyltransferase